MKHLLVFASLVMACSLATAQPTRNLLRETDPTFFKTDDARRIGDQLLIYQRAIGGWPKNIDMARRLTDRELADVLKEKSRRDDSTIDNDATTMQMIYLAHLYRQTGDERYRDAFRRAVEYLLGGQYDNGGWPQFWPEMEGYQKNITFNDDAIVNTLEILRDVARAQEPYDGDLTDPAMRRRLQTAFDKGVECILATQIIVDGQPTVWCQQNDPVTLKPTSARAYELPSYCSQESAGIVRLLMELPDPDARVKRAVHGAMKWFDTYKLTGLRYERITSRESGERNARLVEDPAGTPLWGRFYDLKYCEPYVCDRDGLPRRRLEQIGIERRTGYSWYNDRAAGLYEIYDSWADRHDPGRRIEVSLDTPGANQTGLIEMYRRPVIDRAAFDVIVKPGQSIQAAIEKAPRDAAQPFKILILKGTYNQRIVIDRPNIVLVGEERANTILELTDRDEDQGRVARGERPLGGTVIQLLDGGDDCIISGLTIHNNYSTENEPTQLPHQVPHRMTVRGRATRTIIINCNVWSNGNDALALWAPESGGMYYHADLDLRTPGVDFLCPRGWCYVTRSTFYGDGRAMIWHDGRGDRNKKLVITNSSFDAASPTMLGRYHHDAQFFLINCRLSQQVLNTNISYAYSDRVLDACVWGQRTYYHSSLREGGHSGWLNDNLHQAPDAPASYGVTALWTFDGQWDPEQRIRDLWHVLAY